MWGVCLENLGKYEDALEKYRAIINYAPNSPQAKRAGSSIEMIKKKMHESATKE
jgi:tetratricopeptide (TPR) repeat protein